MYVYTTLVTIIFLLVALSLLTPYVLHVEKELRQRTRAESAIGIVVPGLQGDHRDRREGEEIDRGTQEFP